MKQGNALRLPKGWCNVVIVQRTVAQLPHIDEIEQELNNEN